MNRRPSGSRPLPSERLLLGPLLRRPPLSSVVYEYRDVEIITVATNGVAAFTGNSLGSILIAAPGSAPNAETEALLNGYPSKVHFAIVGT